MSKYEPLGTYLRAQGGGRIAMTFADVERVIGIKLPPSARRHRAWWSNNPINNVATKEWLEAGYVTEQVDVERETLVFRGSASNRVAEDRKLAWGNGNPAVEAKPQRNPLFGALKGLMTIAPGTDLTEPADPEWGERIWGERD